ncbi:MAG: ferrous iron transport protein A [Chloroflexi bacterium]|nr:ferrous iron transport protein A [Chloroflexota bacterium]MBP7041426.1 ferrous iron transport protein A [Chloroflexota bacterium]
MTLTDLFHSGATLHKPQTATAVLPLSLAAAGQPLRLVEIHAGHELTHRLAELGLTRGVELKVVQDAGGPLLISVRGSRIAIGRGMAHKLIVAPV